MTYYNLLFFLYGVSIMFHLMMAFVFIYRQHSLVKRLMGMLMLIVSVQYIKDLPFLGTDIYEDDYIYRVLSCVDSITIPLYVLILIESCRPGWLTLKRTIAIVAPFPLVSALFIALHEEWIFTALLVMAMAYGVSCGTWVIRELPIYRRRLREEFSYEDNINLHWLRGIMVIFFIILIVWVYDNLQPGSAFDAVYMIGSFVAWSVTCFFMYKQELVLSEVMGECDDEPAPLVPVCAPSENVVDAPVAFASDVVSDVASYAASEIASDVATDNRFDAIEQRLGKMFDEERVFLNPHLRLSELAQQLGTNRTYLSQYFNQRCATTFYDYVNDHRIAYAKHLLRTTDDTLETVATSAGFNSISTFRRAFQQRVGCSAIEYRAHNAQ